jgi:hypothetical protein
VIVGVRVEPREQWLARIGGDCPGDASEVQPGALGELDALLLDIEGADVGRGQPMSAWTDDDN